MEGWLGMPDRVNKSGGTTICEEDGASKNQKK